MIALIGEEARSANPDAALLSPNEALLARETAQGLVAFDATGQIEPALADSWMVTDDGLSVIFRLKRAVWPDGREVTGEDVAASLNKAVAGSSRNALHPFLGTVREIVGMTGRVVEIRLSAPRPNLLQLLAQPELGIRRRGYGSGPWRIARQSGAQIVLRPVADPVLADDQETPPDKRQVTLISGRASLGIARLMEGSTNAVMGGTFVDWPLVNAAGLSEAQIRVDPAEGLFGLGVIPRTIFLRDQGIREAIAMAIDRVELVRLFDAQRWKAAERLLPAQLDSGTRPSEPAWINNTRDERVKIARGRVARWIAANGAPPPLKIAMPKGPGAKLLLAKLRADLHLIAIRLEPAPIDATDVDLRLIDAVSPNDSANWYLTKTGCEAGFICNETSQAALVESRTALTLAARAAALSRADKATTDAYGFIPLAKPLRWSLVAPQLKGFRENAFAVHPLATLRRSDEN